MTQTQVSGSGIKNNVITNNHLHSAANIAGSKLADSGVTAGSYGSSSATLSLTINAKGLITAASTNAITQVGGSNGVDFNDNVKARFGTGNDLQIYHNGSDSYIDQTGTGDFYIRTTNTNEDIVVQAGVGGDVRLRTNAGENAVIATMNAGVELYYDNSKKFETTNTGATVSGNLNFGDNNIAIFGSGNDLQIYHDSTNSRIENNIGAIVLKNQAQDGDVLIQGNDGGTNISLLSFDTSETGRATFNGELNINGTNRIRFYHNTGNGTFQSFIGQRFINNSFNMVIDNQQNNIFYQANQHVFRDKAGEGGEVHATMITNGAVSLYYDNSKKFETTSTGVTVHNSNFSTLEIRANTQDALLRLTSHNNDNTDWAIQNDQSESNILDFRFNNTSKMHLTSSGDLHLVGNLDLEDNDKLLLGAGDDLQIYHDGLNSYINETGTGDLIIKTNIFRVRGTNDEAIITGAENGNVALYYDNSKKLETTALGIDLSGTLVTGASDAIVIDDSNNFKFCVGTYSGNSTSTGTVSMDARAYNTNYARLHKWTSPSSGGGSYGNYSEAWYDGGTYRHITTKTTGFEFDHHLIPNGNNSKDLGTSSLRWRNIYTNDLNLSNKGGANDVDGTWGSFTIQEGLESLFLINRRNGKKYKFNLTEID